MMRDYEPDVSQILALYQQLEDDIVASMTKRMLKMGKVSESTKYEAEILQAAGIVYQDILELIAQRTDTTKQHVKALFEDAGVQTLSIDNQIYRKKGILPVDIRQDASLLQILEAGYKKTLGMMKNLVSTTANLAQTAFISACDRAYMQVSSGAFSYQQAIRQAVKSFGDTGAMVQYPSGHRDRMDVAVRRAVLTGVGQTSASVALQHAKNSDCKFMELTAHSGARPEHAAWQGQLVSLDGKNVGKIIDGLRVFSLDQIGYSTGAGFKGWNCRHNWHPYYVGLSTPNYTPEQLQALDAKNIEYNGKLYSEYEISQMQRAAERKVRALKRQVIASQTALENAPDDLTRAELQTDYTQNAVKLKQARKALQEFCKQTGRRNDTFRTQVEGFGRSQAQKAVWATKKSQKDLTFPSSSDKINSSDISGKVDFPIRPLSENAKYFYDTYMEQYAKKYPGYVKVLTYRFNNGSERMQNLFFSKVYLDSVAVTNLNIEEEKPRFSFDSKKIYMNFTLDFAKNGNGRGIGSTYFHEHGHYIDHALGDISIKNEKFFDALEQDFHDFLRGIHSGTNCTFKKRCEIAAEQLQNLRIDNGISDMIHGLSDGTIKGCTYHEKENGSSYWNRSTKCQEAFAHIFEAQFDDQKYARMKAVFPRALKEFESMLEKYYYE